MKLYLEVRRWSARVAAAAVVVLAASCGGGSQEAPGAPQAARVAKLAAPGDVTPTQAMDWAEANYPSLFPAAGKSAGESAPYTYRYYPATGNYLGISTGAADVAVYLLGPVAGSNTTPRRLGTLKSYTCTILPQNCALSNDIAFWGDSMVPPAAANLALLFPGRTTYNGGIAAQSSYDVAPRVVADTARHSWISVFWFGHNNKTDPNQVKADMATSVGALSAGNNRFVVLAIVNKTVAEEAKGTPIYQNLIQLNNDLAAAYPDNYIDMRAWLVAHYNPNIPQDVIDFNNDQIPSSLRHDVDHLNNDGSVLVAQRVAQFINAKGW
ncbi:MAG: hypothetical protein ACAH21_10110 [Ramlibacter sp.]|nr:hypothetical protein [Ramlibacter sp.]